MAAALTPTQQTYVERLYQYLRVQHAAPEAILRWFRLVPRHHYLDTLYLPDRQSGAPREAVRVVPETDDPALLESIYVDSALSIQVCGGVCTSSTSQPSLVAQMMVDVELGPGKQALEVGTASGWNAALMSGVVAPNGQVVTVEIDAQLAEDARRRLALEGIEGVTVVHRDGFHGAAEHGPFDAIVVTVACPQVPRAWLDQMAEGASLIMPFALPDGSAPMLRLARTAGVCHGRFLRQSWFVEVRGGPWDNWPDPLPASAPETTELLRLPETRQPLPWGRVGDGRQMHETLGLFLLLNEPERTVTVREGGGRAAIRYALRADAAPGLCLIGEHEAICHGDFSAAERVMELVEQWIELDAPRLYDYRITVDRSAPLRLERGGVTLAFEL